MGSSLDWKCECGALLSNLNENWRRSGVAWEHHHGCPLGHVTGQQIREPEVKDRRTLACLSACEGISTHALEYGIIQQLREACDSALLILSRVSRCDIILPRETELVTSRLRLVLSKCRDPEPEPQEICPACGKVVAVLFCPEHCPDHNYEYIRGYNVTQCRHCGQDKPEVDREI